MATVNKWGKQYWSDLAERVGSTLIGAFVTALTVTGTTPVDWTDAKVMWAIFGVPTLLVFLKGLLANLGGTLPTASLVNVSSLGDPYSEKPPAGDRGQVGIWYVVGVLLAIILAVYLLSLLL